VRVELIDLTVERGGRRVLDGVNAVFSGPGLVQVIGPNGAGKTTLFLTILGIIKPSKGVVRINDITVNNTSGKLSEVVAYMPQRFHTPSDIPLTLWEFVEDYARIYRSSRKGNQGSMRERVASALRSVGLNSEVWDKKISELSGGQLQRALLARVLSVDAEILLLDEPLSNIDPDGRGLLAEVIGKVSREKLVVVSSHDPVLLLPYTSKVMVLGYGEYRYGDPGEILTKEVLAKIYRSCAIVLGEHTHIADWH